MLVTIISDRHGKVLGMAYNQLIEGDKRFPNAAEIRAFPVGDGTASQSIPSTVVPEDGFECHTLEMPEHLVGKPFEELREFAHVDFSGERPRLRLRAASKDKWNGTIGENKEETRKNKKTREKKKNRR
jgi:hypothetical protein